MDTKYSFAGTSQPRLSGSMPMESERASGSLTNRPHPLHPSLDAKPGNKAVHPTAEQKRLAIVRQRRALPITAVTTQLLGHIRKSSSLIILGETGSGKSTQVPQLALSLLPSASQGVVVTQPRRVAAVSVATRVASEVNCPLGELVGYTVRFEDMTSDKTKLRYVTDGMLVREAMADSLLRRYGFVILDEVHERTLHTDVLFGIIKKAQQQRRLKKLTPLKILIMSATMDVDKFKEYFDCLAVYIEGRTFEVNVKHVLQTQEDYQMACLRTLFMIHKEAPTSDGVLIFVTGQEEIEAIVAAIRIVCKDPKCGTGKIRPLPLYAAMPSHAQMNVFKQMPDNVRKVVISTNIAETTLTISGIRFVIDSGMVKVRTYNSITGLEVLKVQRASKAQIWQRTGRAGRESEGYCYRVFCKRMFESLPEFPVPELLRSNLSSVVMQLAVMNVEADSFDFIDKPSAEAVAAAWLQLQQLGAADRVNSLTDLGRKMAKFPLEPRYSRILLAASDEGCLEEALTVVALLSAESIFVTTAARQEDVASARKKFVSPLGDHLTLLNVFKAHQQAEDQREWCHDHFINARSIAYVTAVRVQLVEVCTRQSLPMSSCGADVDVLRRCLLTGLFTNVAQLCRDKYVALGSKQKVAIHPSSVLFGTKPNCVLFSEIVQTSQSFMRNLTVIEPKWLDEINTND